MKVSKQDVFVHTVAETAVAVSKHKQLFFTILGGVTVLLVGAVSWHYYEKSLYDKWSDKLYAAQLAPNKIGAYESILNDKGPISIKSYAAYLMADLAWQDKQLDKALSAYSDAAKASHPLQKYLAEFARATVIEEKGDLAAAETIYEKLSHENSNPFTDYAKLRQANLMLQNGKADQAKAILQDLANAKLDEKKVSPMVKQAAISQLALILLN